MTVLLDVIDAGKDQGCVTPHVALPARLETFVSSITRTFISKERLPDADARKPRAKTPTAVQPYSGIPLHRGQTQ